MTQKELYKIAGSMAIYIIEKRKNNKYLPSNEIDLYNDWLDYSGLAIIKDTNTLLWAVNHLSSLKRVPLEALIEAAEIDNLALGS